MKNTEIEDTKQKYDQRDFISVVTTPGGGGGGTWVFFGWVCAARDSKLAPRSKKIPLKLIPHSRNGPIFYTPF